jgi:hypothetical protein
MADETHPKIMKKLRAKTYTSIVIDEGITKTEES